MNGPSEDFERQSDTVLPPSLWNNTSGFHVQKIEQGVNTDQSLCNCECEQIPKLKQKAHNSFMQVIQIENLYKEEIDQLKQSYLERQKNNDMKYKQKELTLHEKCRHLQEEIEKVKKSYISEKFHQIEIDINPFSSDNIEPIITSPLDFSNSTSSIFNLKDFAAKKNLQQYVSAFDKQITEKLQQIKIHLQIESEANQHLDDAFSILSKLFEFMRELRESAVFACDRYNDVMRNNQDLQTKFFKSHGKEESLQKQTKFMSDQIKRLSQEKIRMEKKVRELEYRNHLLEENEKKIKKNLKQKGLNGMWKEDEGEDNYMSSEDEQNKKGKIEEIKRNENYQNRERGKKGKEVFVVKGLFSPKRPKEKMS